MRACNEKLDCAFAVDPYQLLLTYLSATFLINPSNSMLVEPLTNAQVYSSIVEFWHTNLVHFPIFCAYFSTLSNSNGTMTNFSCVMLNITSIEYIYGE